MNIKIILTTLFILLVLLFGCTENQPSPEDNGKLSIVTTIYPLYEFAREVGGDKINVTLLLPPGAEAHTFEPKPSDIIKINQADLFIYTGAGMEPWAQDILEGIDNKKLIIMDASSKINLLAFDEHEHEEVETHEHEEVELHDHEDEVHADDTHIHTEEHHHGEYDPHIWLDFSNDLNIVSAIAEELSKLDPLNLEYYFSNANKYNLELKELDTNYAKAFLDCNHHEFINGGHDAFGYLAKRYNLETISASGISPNSEPTPQKMKEIIDLTKEKGIKYIYFEELVNPNIAQAIANEAGTQTLVINPAANLSREQLDKNTSFISVMKDNLKSLKTGLECN
jgi:zinc transport system substrate-binding protein